MGTINPDKIIETITFKETSEGMEDKIIQNTEIIGTMNTTDVNYGVTIWVNYILLEGQLVLCYRYLSKPMQY